MESAKGMSHSAGLFKDQDVTSLERQDAIKVVLVVGAKGQYESVELNKPRRYG